MYDANYTGAIRLQSAGSVVKYYNGHWIEYVYNHDFVLGEMHIALTVDTKWTTPTEIAVLGRHASFSIVGGNLTLPVYPSGGDDGKYTELLPPTATNFGSDTGKMKTISFSIPAKSAFNCFAVVFTKVQDPTKLLSISHVRMYTSDKGTQGTVEELKVQHAASVQELKKLHLDASTSVSTVLAKAEAINLITTKMSLNMNNESDSSAHGAAMYITLTMSTVAVIMLVLVVYLSLRTSRQLRESMTQDV
jgi:hypothetical protein